MNSLQKRIIIELLITPMTVIPALAGGTLLLLCEVIGGYSAFFGFSGLVIAAGAFATNLVLNFDNVSKRAIRQQQKQTTDKKERELDNLDRRLAKTSDDQDENALRNLRVLYKSFCSDVEGGKLSENVPPQMLDSIDELFDTCVEKLERSYEIYKTAEKMTGRLNRDLVDQRNKIISDVETSVHNLADVINEARALKFKNEDDDLRQLQKKLASQLEVAKATEDGMADFMNANSRINDKLKEYE